MKYLDPAIIAHLEWIGFVQPKGLVVSAPALVRAGAILDRRDTEGQNLLRGCVQERTFSSKEGPEPWLPDFRGFASTVLKWSFSPKGYAGILDNPIPQELVVPLPEYSDILRPHFAVRELEPQSGRPPWQLLVTILDPGMDFDAAFKGSGMLEASAHGRMERLLRQTGVAAGLLFNGKALRLISAPRGESSGWMDFRVSDMIQTTGRPIATALRLLLSQSRLLSLPRSQRLTALLEESRKFQNEVSERLAEQVLHALYELLRGLQSAHDASKGELLHDVLRDRPDEVYRSLLTVILRLVFLLYAEERDMLPEDETFLKYYSVSGLFDRLREDAAMFPDTMDQRYGGWAQLLVLFRMIFDGAICGAMKLPRRHGVLFDPDRYPFLEGRLPGISRQAGERIEAPLIPDGTIYRALEKLLVLDGERISYRALDVEQIGSVYETMMGFRLEMAKGPSIAVKTQKKHGAPSAVDLNALLGMPIEKRDKWLQEQTDRKFTDTVKKAVKDSQALEDLHAALQPVVDLGASPDIVPMGAMVLQPSDERRRSGSHYTPRSLTEPIVRTALEPVLLGLKGQDVKPPRPEQILDLKVCDPAMGSGAFLVEACRQLGDALVESWRVHGGRPVLPPDEDEVVNARRLVAQRCLYGVDKNPVAVDLAKVSLWLITLAKDHPLTFVDHALRHGDSLVGLSRRQIEAFHWEVDEKPFDAGFVSQGVREPLSKITELRRQIREAGDNTPDWELRDLWDKSEYELRKIRLFGDLAVSAFFEGENTKDRERIRSDYARDVLDGRTEQHRFRLEEWRHVDKPLVPFHWELEFPEVFERQNLGFDAFVGNPPFAGKNTMANGNVEGYPDWLKLVHAESHGNSDLVAHFFRRAFTLIRTEGTFGLIATNTIAQGDTRSTGLRWICLHGGEVYAVQKRVKWPGQAAVVVSVVHVTKGLFKGKKNIDDRECETITAFLFHRGGSEDPARLEANAGKSFQGSIVLGMGFTFDDTDTKGVVNPKSEMCRLIEKDPVNKEVIFPYIGGEEVNTSPTHAHHRYVINFGERTELECREKWPDLMDIVETKVRPKRLTDNRDSYRRYWWQYAEKRNELNEAIEGLERVLVISQVTQHIAFAFLPIGMVLAHRLYVFPDEKWSTFMVIQSRLHEVWARFLGSSLEERFMYAVADCFETFPFPANWETHQVLEEVGITYYEFRAVLMVKNNEGLTKTYNRFHDPDERDSEILRLRELHASMDRAVLDAYGWSDIHTDCEFLLDYEIDEEEYANRKKPYRYRWPDEVRDEVLVRLLELNRQRAEEEARAGLTREKKKVGRVKKKGTQGTAELF